MNSPNYAYFLGPKKISSSSNYLESLNAQRNVKRRKYGEAIWTTESSKSPK